MQHLFVYGLLPHESRVELGHVRADFSQLEVHQFLGPFLGSGRVLVVVHLLAGESESFFDYIGEDGQVEGLRIIEGFDCASRDPRNDLPHRQRKQQA